MPNRLALLVVFLLVPRPFAHAEPSYQGTYASDCAKQKEASVTIADDAIVLRTASGARTLRPVDKAPAAYGRVAPSPGFVTLLMVDALPGKALNVEVFASNNVTTITLSGHPDVENGLPASLRRKRLRRCEGSKPAPDPAPRRDP